MNNIVRAISRDGGAVVIAIDSTNIVKTTEEIHKTSAVVSAALGRLLTGACLMGTFLKNPDDSLTLQVNGGGPIGRMVVVTDGNGNVKGYTEHTIVEIADRADGKLDVGTAVGRDGTLAVIRDMGFGEPYVGQVPLVSGEIAEDITSYYATSEQTPTVCALGVLVNKDLSIKVAGGYLLQLLPGSTDEEIALLENNIKAMPSVTDFFSQGGTPEELALMVLDGFEPNVLDESQGQYLCKCSYEKTEKIVFSLGLQELEDLVTQMPVAEVCCDFCNKKYEIPLQPLIDEMKNQN